MSLAAGALTKVAVSSTTASVSSAVATGGTTPYSYQWYRDISSGFSPGGGNIIAGATALTLNDSGLTPGTQYYYKVVVTDSAGTPATANSAALNVATSQPTLGQNQFQQAPFLGMIDMRFDYDTVSAQIDASQVGTLYAGMPVKIVDSAGGVPKVIGIAADSDEVFGYINFDIKTQVYNPGDMCELSQAGNVMYLYATGAISRGVQVFADITTNGGVSAGSTGNNLVGWAFDKAVAAGQLFRVKLLCPSFAFHS